MPKGVVVTHAGSTTSPREQRDRFACDADVPDPALLSPSFDASVLEYLHGLRRRRHDGDRAADRVRRRGTRAELLRATGRVTHAFITTAALATVDPDGLDEFSTWSSAARPARRNW